MRLHSSADSIQNREVTILALIETVLAVAVSAFAATRGRFGYLALTTLVVPFLLLRTDRSVQTGLEWLRKGLGAYTNLHWSLTFLLFIPFTLSSSLAIKVAATIVSVLRRPLESIVAIPSNWFLLVLCVDSWHPPELVPGIERAASGKPTDDDLSLLTVRSVLREVRSPHGWSRLAAVLFLVSITPAFIAAFVYRISLKSTAPVWAPLLWIVPKLQPSDSLRVRLRLLNVSSWGRFVVWTSTLVVAGFAAKVLVYNSLFVLSESLFDGNLGLLILDYIAPTTMPWWQVASVMNAVMAIGLYFWSGDEIVRMDENPAYTPGHRTDVVLRAASFGRSCLSVYTSACLAYLAVARLQAMRWPPLGDKLFPWM